MYNYYELLEVAESASTQEIKKAFRERAKKLHPDISGKSGGEEMRKLLASASLAGKKGAAFLKKTGPFFVNKALCNLMRVMEKEGMMVNWSEVLLSSDHANAMGKRIGA